MSGSRTLVYAARDEIQRKKKAEEELAKAKEFADAKDAAFDMQN
jgi:hypothetical protein